MNVLVTGGCGYIGSHAAMRLLEDGHAVTIVDDLTRGHREVINALDALGDLRFVEADLGHTPTMVNAMKQRSIDLVMHFGALAYVGESMDQPLRYYQKNTVSSHGLLKAMDEAGVKRLVFSSTCATYGEPDESNIPIAETCPQDPINPYGRSKLMFEHILFDYAAMKKAKGEDFGFAALRYFNVAGSDRKGRVGEDHKPETHLIPICLEVAAGQRPHITIFGTDYPTPDGTCVRDYVHVEDLIDAHVTVMNALKSGDTLTYNIGIGKGYSVREIIDACRRVTGVDFKEVEGERRPGDPPQLYNDPTKVREALGWSAQITDLDAIIDSAWQWKKAHPNGYELD